jgi:AmmeMemoRadiSam system protein B
MPGLERPRLRPHLSAELDGREGSFVLEDPLELAGRRVRVSALEMTWLRLFDGQHTLRDIQAEAMRRIGGHLIPLDVFTRLFEKLDDALFLDSPRFQERYQAEVLRPVRPPACAASYGDDPAAIRRLLDCLFRIGAGIPSPQRPDPRFCAALVPHIDYARGGTTYTWAFREVFERSPAQLFVIVGTSHYSPARFTLTRKHFQTPLGIAQTDQAYIDRLAAHYGPELFDDELHAHCKEHSIELEVVFLQYLMGERPFRIVPLLVGSFRDCILSGSTPTESDDIGRMIDALRAAERETSEPICYLISGDLAHIGPYFGDPRPLSAPVLQYSRTQDEALLERAEAVDVEGFFRVIAEEGDGRRICGLPPAYTVLEALRPGHARRLHYQQYAHPAGEQSVSFCSMTFYR